VFLIVPGVMTTLQLYLLYSGNIMCLWYQCLYRNTITSALWGFTCNLFLV